MVPASLPLVFPMGTSVHASLEDELRTNFPSFDYIKVMYGMTEMMLMSSSRVPTNIGFPDAGWLDIKYLAFATTARLDLEEAPLF